MTPAASISDPFRYASSMADKFKAERDAARAALDVLTEDYKAMEARAVTAEAEVQRLRDDRTKLTGDTSRDIAITYGFEVGHEEGQTERAELRADVQRLRELAGYLIDACATHRIAVPFHSSLQDLMADIAGGAVAAVSSGAATPTVCPTCGSDDPALYQMPCVALFLPSDPGSPDPWHTGNDR